MGYQNPIVRNNESVELLNYGFSSFELVNVIKYNECVTVIDNILFKNNQIKIVSKSDYFMVIKKGTKDQITTRFKYIINKENLKNNVGHYDIYYNNEHIESLELIVNETKRKNIFEVFIDILIKSLN